MERKVCMTLVMFMVILFFGGCVTSLQDYKPISSDEANVKEFFILMENAWNNKDINGVLALYHDNAKIMSGRERKIFSKREYTESLGNLKGVGKIKFGIPKMIKFVKFYENKNRAKVDISMILQYENVVLQAKFTLVRSSGSWLILKRTYTY